MALYKSIYLLTNLLTYLLKISMQSHGFQWTLATSTWDILMGKIYNGIAWETMWETHENPWILPWDMRWRKNLDSRGDFFSIFVRKKNQTVSHTKKVWRQIEWNDKTTPLSWWCELTGKRFVKTLTRRDMQGYLSQPTCVLNRTELVDQLAESCVVVVANLWAKQQMKF